MRLKRRIAIAAMMALLLTGAVGCGKRPSAEEGASTNEYVESDKQTGEQDLPEIVGDPTVIPDPNAPVQNTPVENPADTPADPPTETPDTPVENSPSEETPSDSEETPETEQSGSQNSVAVDPSNPNWWKDEDQPANTPSSGGEEDSGSTGEDEEPETVDPNLLKIVSYNIRCVDDSNPAGHAISERAPRLKALMDELDPDIMGMQEVTSKWDPYLKEYFNTTYDCLNKDRGDKERAPIYWKKDKFSVVDEGYFWLSETPDVESKAVEWGANNYRICMWVKLKIKATGKTILFVNTHLDTKGDDCRLKSVQLILGRVEALGGFGDYPAICTGDFNTTVTKSPIKEMLKKFSNANFENSKTPTFTKYATQKGSIIDFCFYGQGAYEPVAYQVYNPKTNGGYPSDHSCVYTELKLLS